MHEELIRVVQEIQTQKQSGLLMAVVKISAQAQAGNDVTAVSNHADFSFFFKEGELATVISRGIRGGSVISKIAAIASITRTQWTATNSSTISVADKPLGTDHLLELLGARKIEKALVDGGNDNARRAIGLALEVRSKQVFLQVLGRSGDAARKGIRSRCDPYQDADGFTSACVAELEPLIGMDSAKALMS
jgi:hypothetical protein